MIKTIIAEGSNQSQPSPVFRSSLQDPASGAKAIPDSCVVGYVYDPSLVPGYLHRIMSTPSLEDPRPSRGSAISHHLRAARKELHDILFGTSVTTALTRDELDALSQEILGVSSLIRSIRNRLAPINKLPNDIFTLLPDFLDKRAKKKMAVTLTHVCQAWREIFVTCVPLWTDFECKDAHKTRVYFERSKGYPINLWLEKKKGLPPNDPFLEIAPHIFSRLKNLSLETTPNCLQDITKHLTQPAPLLESLTINEDTTIEHGPIPVLTTELFGGDLTSLRELRLQSVRTSLPWRGMNNLTTFTLGFIERPTLCVGDILDFFEGAPRLSEINFHTSSPSSDSQDGRLVSLEHLRKLTIYGPEPPSIMLNHLVIPVGASVLTHFDSPNPHIGGLFPESLDNLKNLPNFTHIRLNFDQFSLTLRFAGPNGRFLVSFPTRPDSTHLIVRAMPRFDTSHTHRLDLIDDGPMTNEILQLVRSLKNLRTLRVSQIDNMFDFFLAINSVLNEEKDVPCQKLEEFICRARKQPHTGVMAMFAKGRASRGVPLKSIKVVSFGDPAYREDIEELREHVPHVELSFGRYRSRYYRDESSDEDG